MSILTITPICDYLVGIDWVGYLFQHIGRWFRMYHFESVLFAIKIHYQITFNGVARMKLLIWKCELAKIFLYFHLIRDIIFYVVYFFSLGFSQFTLYTDVYTFTFDTVLWSRLPIFLFAFALTLIIFLYLYSIETL